MSRLPADVCAVYFDAVGTLIHPEPSAGTVYAEAGRRFGSTRTLDEVHHRFASAFRAEERIDAAHGQWTDEAREYLRWQSIVGRVLDDVRDQAGCFQHLYDHFAQARAWRVEAEAEPLLRALDSRGIRVGIASNFDHRLRDVLAGVDELSWVKHVLVSSEVGWKKPARAFFDRLAREVNLAPSQILFIGDDPDNDFLGARAAGLHALLFDPHGRSTLPSCDRLVALGELLV